MFIQQLMSKEMNRFLELLFNEELSDYEALQSSCIL